MLIVARKLRELSFGKLMEVYQEGNLENGQIHYPDEQEDRQIALAEQDFYQYLHQVFFRTDGAVYFIWEEHGKYVSALRLEPYRDGLLLAALETHPQMRRKGYAAKLILEVMTYAKELSIYSHVSKKNIASLRTHEKCGFERIMEYAVYADGSVNDKSYTFCYRK